MKYHISLFEDFVQFNGKQPYLKGDVKGLRSLEVTSQELFKIALTKPFIGAKFKNGYKVNDDWECSNLIILDIDWASSGELEIFRAKISNITYGELATQSDSLEQPKRRFIIPMSEIITDSEFMKFLIRYFTKMANGDTSASVLHRHWAVHKKVLNVNKKVHFNPSNIKHLYDHELYNQTLKKQYEISQGFKKDLFIKTHNELVNSLSVEGVRSTSLCSLIGKIKKLGFGEAEVRDVLSDGYCNLPKKEIDMTLKSLFR